MRNTVRILLRQNRDEEAARILDEMLARVREKSGETQDLLGLGGLFLEYSQVLIEEGRFEAAESSVRRSIEYFSRCLWIDRRVHLPIARTLLGRCLAGQGHFEEAESLLLQGYGEIEGHPFVPPGDKRQVEGWIVSLYEDWGKPDKAEEWRAKLP
jgi:tetratricopeptide (TPR) repeat protein